MAIKCEEEFNPWPSFVDIFSSVILVMLLFLLITLVNLGYYAQFKYKISYSGSISSDDLIILNNNRSSEPNEPNTKKVTDPVSGSSNADLDLQIIDEDKQKILLLEKQNRDKEFDGAEDQENELESPGIDVSQKIDTGEDSQEFIENKDYLIIVFSDSGVFIDDGSIKKLKVFLNNIEGNHKILIESGDIKNQVSSTISKQISLARTISTRNLIRKFGYKKKDVKISLSKRPELKEKIDDKNGYLLIKIKR